MKIGDKVRFLSEIGGGRVAGFEGKDVVLVEDEDGFQVPMRVNDVVVVGEENYDFQHVVEVKQQKGISSNVKDDEPANRPVTFKAMPEERRGGDRLSAYMAFVPIDLKELTNTRFEVYFVNDSNYYMRFTFLSTSGNSWICRSTAEVEPNTKLYIEEFGRENLNEMERICIQILPYKRTKTFLLKPAVDVQFRLDAVKFYKLHTFQTNDFFEQPALVYTLIENDKPMNPLVLNADQLKQQIYKNTIDEKKLHPLISPARKEGDQLVVDLHADEILETTAGMNASDILNYQLDTFRKILNENSKQKGMKIIFIHGKGEGVLRQALINELRYRFKTYIYQDASFQEYGYGATQVTIK